MDFTEILKLAGCDTPGKKIRSKGKGRGLARGDGKGPLGTPVGVKEAYDFGVRLAAMVASKNPAPYNNPKAQHQVGKEVPLQSLRPKPLQLKKNIVAKI